MRLEEINNKTKLIFILHSFFIYFYRSKCLSTNNKENIMLCAGTVTIVIEIYTLAPGSLHSIDKYMLNGVSIFFCCVIYILLARDAMFPQFKQTQISIFSPVNNAQEAMLQTFQYRLTTSSVFVCFSAGRP